MDLSIIIVNYKNREKLFNCLDSLTAATLGALRREVIVVDNHSGDDLSTLPCRYPKVKFIASPRNRGMGGGNNLGLDKASGDYLLILNPDTIVNGPAVETLLAYLRQNPEVGVVGPKLLYPDGALQSSCARFPSFFMPVLRRTFLGDYFRASRDLFTMNDFDHSTIKEVDWLMGSCLLFRREIVLADSRIFRPRFDERYFMYFEDTDLCRQMWRRGLKVVYNPEAIIIHDHARQSARHPWYVAIFIDPLTWRHIASWLKYFFKWGLRREKGSPGKQVPFKLPA